MKREVLATDIASENLYRSSDMVRLNANGCKDCSYCCREMTDTIILDPWDVFQLSKGLGISENDRVSLSGLLSENLVKLSVFEGLTLPHLASSEKQEGACVFLDDNERCRVHSARPGFCRLFPLGRYYENNTFYYFLQSGECIKKDRTKVKISNWLGIKNLKAYEDYILKWHEIQENIKSYLKECNDENAAKINSTLLRLFYLSPYDVNRDFYEQFEERRAKLL